MTENYPLLTIENVKYLYWGCDPAYSMGDISKATGAPYTTVQRFMNKNNISRRNRSEANFNRFRCAHKKESFLEQRNSPEFKKNLSEKAAALWTDNTRRENIIRNLKKYNETVLGDVQAQILYVLRNYKGMFLSKLGNIVRKEKMILDHTLRSLLNRGLVTRQKQLNLNTINSYTSHYFYSITDKGVALISEKENDPKFTSLLNPLITLTESDIKKPKGNKRLTYLGKNQKVILGLFQEKHSLFLTDLKKLTTINVKILDKSLRGLYKRGILSRKEEFNSESSYLAKHYKYRLTEVGKTIKVG